MTKSELDTLCDALAECGVLHNIGFGGVAVLFDAQGMSLGVYDQKERDFIRRKPKT